MTLRIAAVAAHQPFLDVLAARWLAQAEETSDPMAAARGLILLPTRRAVRGLHEAFLRATNGRPLLLPRIEAIGAPDEMPYALRGALDLPQPIAAPQRLAHLTRLILAMQGRDGAPESADRAWPLAASLAQLLDEAARAELDLRPALRNLVAEEFADHWRTITDFLKIVTEQWPRFLAEAALSDIAARQVALLRAEADRWEQSPPSFPIWAAGSTGGIGVVARLLGVVAQLPRGLVILPGLDLTMADEVWDAIEPGHPQAGLRSLLDRMGVHRADVESWNQTATTPRGRLLDLALIPAKHVHEWDHLAPGIATPDAIAPLNLIEPADQQEEALAIAIALRQAIEQPGRRAALITPDRTLAVRVAAELARFGVVADDSAGEALADTPPALLLRLLVQAVLSGLAPVTLLALLKHPLARFGLSSAACRDAARSLELTCLRGPAPAPGVAGLRARLKQSKAREHVSDLLDRLDSALDPLARLLAQDAAEPGAFLELLITAGETLARTGDPEEPAPLWALEEGEALAEHLAELRPAFAALPPQDPAALPGLFAAALEGKSVRSRRALRGRGAQGEHPRVFIWGLLEARLQQVDLAVMGGLVEGVWPPAPDSGPWMNRRMRAAAGLPSPEEQITQAAHDFVMIGAGAAQVICSVPKRRDGAPCVPARWITRLIALLKGQGLTLAQHPAADWARAIDRPDPQDPQIQQHPPRPAPCPPLASRPRKLSVTDVELWFNDPYGLYAKKILHLARLDPLEQNADHVDFGTLVHEALAAFYRAVGDQWPADAVPRLTTELGAALEAASLRPAILNWWRPRLARIAGFIDAAERDRREHVRVIGRAVEIKGELTLQDFTLTARADRIERVASDDGEGCAVIDYKTGTPPSQSAVAAGVAPQLPLEGMMLQYGGFGADLQGEIHTLEYWRLSGGREPGKVISLWSSKDQRANTELYCGEAYEGLLRQIALYRDPAQPYRSAPDPGRLPRYSDYVQLARRAEWAALEDDAAEDGEAPLASDEAAS